MSKKIDKIYDEHFDSFIKAADDFVVLQQIIQQNYGNDKKLLETLKKVEKELKEHVEGLANGRRVLYNVA